MNPHKIAEASVRRNTAGMPRFLEATKQVDTSDKRQVVKLRYLAMVARAEGLIDQARILTDWIDCLLYLRWREAVQ